MPVAPARVEMVKVTPVRLAEPKPTPQSAAQPLAPKPAPLPVTQRVISRSVEPQSIETARQHPQSTRGRSAASSSRQNGVASARPLELEPAYPQATSAPTVANSSPRGKPMGGKARGSSPPPLWQPEPEVTPSPSDEGEAESHTSMGEQDGKGIVVEAYPLGRVDLATPNYMALRRAEIVAKFQIASDGSAEVQLQPGTGIPEVDAEVIAYLKTIRWSPKTVGGIPVSDTQELTFSKDGS